MAFLPDSKDLYLDLMKKALSFLLWPEPPFPAASLQSTRKAAKRILVGALSAVAKAANKSLMQYPSFTEQERKEGRIWPGYAHTMVGMKRLDNIQFCVETVLKEGVPGDLIETGVWRGGACIFMRSILAAYGDTQRKLYVADSFQGLPPPDEAKYPADKGDWLHTQEVLAVSLEQVKANFANYGLLDGQVEFLKGWFKDTLPSAPMEKLAVMRLDGDLYQSTMEALESLYPRLSPGGFCIIDDYALRTCQLAVDDFRKQRGILETLEVVDWTGRFWRKRR